MKSQIYQIASPLEIYFTHKGVKFLFIGADCDERGHTFHTIQNSENGKKSVIAHSVLADIVDFYSKPILIK